MKSTIVSAMVGALILASLAAPAVAEYPRAEQGQPVRLNWSDEVPQMTLRMGGINAEGVIRPSVIFNPPTTDIEVVFTILDARGVLLDLESTTFSVDGEGDYEGGMVELQDGGNPGLRTLTTYPGLRTMQIHLIDRDTEAVLGSLVTVYTISQVAGGGVAMTGCYQMEQMCIRGTTVSIDQDEFSPAWGWKLNNTGAFYTGGTEYIPVCYYGGEIVCTEEQLAYVDSKLGYDHALSLALLRSQVNSDGPIELTDVPESLVVGGEINVSISGAYVSASAILYHMEDGVYAPIGFDQAQFNKPLVSFRVPIDASGDYRLNIAVIGYGGEKQSYSYDYVI